MTKQSKIMTMLLVTAFVCISSVFVIRGCGSFLWFILFGRTSEKSMAFDPNVWKRDTEAAFADANYVEIYSATRDLMVDNLLKQHKLVGMHREDIVGLLGEPDMSCSLLFPQWDFIYWLGPDNRGAFGHLDSMWLVMKCDPNGAVTACQKTYD